MFGLSAWFRLLSSRPVRRLSGFAVSVRAYGLAHFRLRRPPGCAASSAAHPQFFFHGKTGRRVRPQVALGTPAALWYQARTAVIRRSQPPTLMSVAFGGAARNP